MLCLSGNSDAFMRVNGSVNMSSKIDENIEFLDNVVTSLKIQLQECEDNIIVWQNIQKLTQKAQVEIQKNLPVVGGDAIYATRLKRLSGSLKSVIRSSSQSMN